MRIKYLLCALSVALIALILANPALSQKKDLTSAQKRAFSWQDAMKFKSLRQAVISDDGSWAAYTAIPDRGESEAFFVFLNGTNTFTVPRGSNPVIASSSQWAKTVLQPKAIDIDNAITPKDRPKSGLVLLNLSNGEKVEFESVKSSEFSNDSKWLAYLLNSDEGQKKGDGDKNKFKADGAELNLRHLASGTEIRIDNVVEYAFDSLGAYLFYAVSDKKGKRDGIYARLLNEVFCPEKIVKTETNALFSNISWNIRKNLLSFVYAKNSDCGKPKEGSIFVWNPSNGELSEKIIPATFPGWFVPSINKLQWSKDGNRLFFGLKPIAEIDTTDMKETKFTDSTYFSESELLRRSKLYIWHWNDKRISTHQRNWWEKNKNRTYTAVYHYDLKMPLRLADSALDNVLYSESPSYSIGYDETPYLKLQTWEGFFKDLYLVNINTGERKKIAEKIEEDAQLSMSGRILAFFKNGNWSVYDASIDSTIDLTSRVPNPFAIDDFDEPRPAPSYGFVGWVNNDEGILVYDKWDLWFFSATHGYGYICYTAAEGKIENIRFRVVKTDKDKDFYTVRDTLLIHSFNYKDKSQGFNLIEMSIMGAERKIHGEKRFNFIAKAKNSNRILYTRESFDEFPDLLMTDFSFAESKKITNLNPQKNDYKWGKSELVEWSAPSGDTLQGILIKPDGYDPKKRYPALIYFYDRMSDYLYNFHQPMLTHRPCFHIYLSDGYVIFQPDIKYRDGFPGKSALDALLSGAKKLVEMGIADSNAIGIQGHSWGAYQAAYIATQTDYFKASCAGAPVGNMISAYSGIRLESGLARQFQYEAYQSRIGGMLWDSLDSYLRNSPVITAQGNSTPLLISHGEIDEAVPWHQSVELYLAMRRLNKNCIFLHYPDEPHHLKKYWNKLDYSIRMKEFFDVYLRGKPAPEWIIKGKEYRGEEN